MAYSDKKKPNLAHTSFKSDSDTDTSTESDTSNLDKPIEDSMMKRVKGYPTTDTDMHFDLFANEEKVKDINNIIHHQRHEGGDDEGYSDNLDDYVKKTESDSSSSQSQSRSPRSPHSSIRQSTRKEFNEEEEMHKKLEMLKKLGELSRLGVKISQNYTMNSSLKSMEFEYALHADMRKKHNGVKWLSNLMVHIIKGVEWSNDYFDPFGFELNGWAEHVNDDIDEYYEVLGELHDKYFSSGQEIPPELKLMFMISGSAVSFHMQKKFFGNVPNLQDALKSNPKLADKLKANEEEILKKTRDIQMLKEKEQIWLKQQDDQSEYLESELARQKQKIQDLERQLMMQRSDTRSNSSVRQSRAPRNQTTMRPPSLPASLRNIAPFKDNKSTDSTSSSVRYNPNIDKILGTDNKSLVDDMSSIGSNGSVGSDGIKKRRGRPPKTLKINT